MPTSFAAWLYAARSVYSAAKRSKGIELKLSSTFRMNTSNTELRSTRTASSPLTSFSDTCRNEKSASGESILSSSSVRLWESTVGSIPARSSSTSSSDFSKYCADDRTSSTRYSASSSQAWRSISESSSSSCCTESRTRIASVTLCGVRKEIGSSIAWRRRSSRSSRWETPLEVSRHGQRNARRPPASSDAQNNSRWPVVDPIETAPRRRNQWCHETRARTLTC